MSRKLFAFIPLLALAACAQPSAKAPAFIDATDKAAVQAALPRTVTVQGTVTAVGTESGSLHIDFKGTEQSQFYAVVLARNVAAVQKAFDGDVAKALTGKTIRVTGNVVLYHDRPEIIIDAPGQIVIGK